MPLIPSPPFEIASPGLARRTGSAYLLLIALGLFAEVLVRGQLIAPGDPETTAEQILASAFLYRLGVAADAIVFGLDVFVATALVFLLWNLGPLRAVLAGAFQLTGTSIYSANLMLPVQALLRLEHSGTTLTQTDIEAAGRALELHAYGYDLGLVFFGAHCLVLGLLFARAQNVPRVLAGGMFAAALAYLLGGATRWFIPSAHALIQPLYAGALFGELSLAVWLLRAAPWTRQA